MKHFITIAGTLLIVGATVIACVGSYKAHRQSAQIRVMPPDVVFEIEHCVEYVEVPPEEIQKSKGTDAFNPVVFSESDLKSLNLTYEEQCLLLDIAMAEAEGEDAIGKALVMITVINRINEYDAPVDEIIYAPHQFATYRMGKQPIDNCYEALDMVTNGWNEMEVEGDWDKTKKILWFCADGYPIYGEPMFKYGGHYFSGL